MPGSCIPRAAPPRPPPSNHAAPLYTLITRAVRVSPAYAGAFALTEDDAIMAAPTPTEDDGIRSAWPSGSATAVDVACAS